MRSFVCAAVLAGANQFFAPYGPVAVRQGTVAAVPAVEIPISQPWQGTHRTSSGSDYTSLAAFALGFGGVVAATYARAGKVQASAAASSKYHSGTPFSDPQALRAPSISSTGSSFHSGTAFSDPTSYRGMQKPVETSGAIRFAPLRPAAQQVKKKPKLIGEEFADPETYRSTPIATVTTQASATEFSDLSATGMQKAAKAAAKMQAQASVALAEAGEAMGGMAVEMAAELQSAVAPAVPAASKKSVKKTARSRPVTAAAAEDPYSFTCAVLGDLHLDPRKMEDYELGREHFRKILRDAEADGLPTAVVSLGDLGESKSVRPDETQELFAGTSECHELAAEFLGSFGTPYEVIGGNHDLEGIDEFQTDEENLEAYLRIHNKPTPQFKRQIAEKTLLVGLGSTVFRAAKYTSHEVTIDDEQLAWFEKTVEDHPASDGWRIFIFTHAPPIGSGLRVLQENHVVNGCCWLNHTTTAPKFIDIVRKNACIKAWFSGHFHLGQDYEDSITFPVEGANRGSCTFAQTSVMRKGTSRDTRQQSRLIRGNKDGFEICTVNHAKGGEIRLDASVSYSDCMHEVGVFAHEHEDLEHDNYMKIYSPEEGDACFIADIDGDLPDACGDEEPAWWYMSCGRVLGISQGMLIEYDPSTLAPLGLVVGADELKGKKVAVVDSGVEACFVGEQMGMEGADCANAEATEQAVLLYDDEGVTVVQPNEDGSYWRKIVRNKMIRMKEKRREQAAELFRDGNEIAGKVVSSWGPYTSTVGTAKNTGVAGLTKKAKLVSA